MSAPAALARRLGLVDAIAIGLGSMIGAGVFAAFAPAAAAAGSGLLIGLTLAAVVAYANATSSAQLAAQFPTSGGTYVYGREMIGPWSGFFAGWSFVIGKTASCAAMALTFASYAAPAGWEKPVAVAAVLGRWTSTPPPAPPSPPISTARSPSDPRRAITKRRGPKAAPFACHSRASTSSTVATISPRHSSVEKR